MATLSKGYSFGATEEVTAAKLHSLVDSATIASIATADISNSAITDAKINDVSGAKFTTLTTIPAGAGVIPAANLPTDNVKLTTDQTVAGVKSFSSFPVTPSEAPTTDYQVANKKYVDDNNCMIQATYTSSSTVITCNTAIPCDDTAPQSTEGNEVMTLAITPTSATNYLRIQGVVYGYEGAGQTVCCALFKDSDSSAFWASAGMGSGAGTGCPQVIDAYVVAGGTSEITIKLRVGVNNGGNPFYFNGTWGGTTSRYYGGALKSTLTITELYSS